MKYNIGDLFVVEKHETISILILEEENKTLSTEYYKVIIYYPEGKTKIQHLDADAIEHYVITKQFIHYPVKE